MSEKQWTVVINACRDANNGDVMLYYANIIRVDKLETILRGGEEALDCAEATFCSVGAWRHGVHSLPLAKKLAEVLKEDLKELGDLEDRAVEIFAWDPYHRIPNISRLDQEGRWLG